MRTDAKDYVRAESFAAEKLRREGHIILARNYRVPGVGELDIVSMKAGRIYATEVKARQKGGELGTAGAFTPVKRARTIRTLMYYLAEQNQMDRPLALLAAEVLWDHQHEPYEARLTDWV